MEDVSVLLWTKLRRFVGTEAQVYIRRKCTSSYEALFTDRNVIAIYSGSQGEGLNLPGSDTDLMFVLKPITVLPTSYTYNQHCDLCIETNNIKPGFARLKFVGRIPSRYDPFFASSIIEKDENMYLSSGLFRHEAVMTLRGDPHGNVEYHGPCATRTEFGGREIDYALCLHCPVWPHEASEWMHRYRPNNWPPTELVQQIVDEGCLLVPVGNPQSNASYLEWRISFSLAEKMLSHSMNHTQFLCYGLLKLYLKYVIDSIEGVGGLLCSYFLKTCLFYCIEEENISWHKENFIVCFWTCFKRLYLWVREGYCPNYFIKENNMFESKIYGDNQRRLLQCFTTLYHQGLDVFIKIPCLSDVGSIMAEANSGGSRHALFCHSISEPEHELMCDIELFTSFNPYTTKIIKRHMLLEDLLRRPLVSKVEQVHISSALFCANIQLSQHMYWKIACKQMTNKEKYKHITKLKQFILCTKQGDICTGLLQYATLCYISGQYDKVIHIVRHVLSKFSDFTVFKGLSDWVLQSKPAYITEVCGRGLTIAQKLKHYVAHSYVCVNNCQMYPSEIRDEIINYSYLGKTSISPIVYSDVLLFLACNALGYIELRNYAVNEVYVAVHDEDTVDDLERPLCFALLDKCNEIVNLNL